MMESYTQTHTVMLVAKVDGIGNTRALLLEAEMSRPSYSQRRAIQSMECVSRWSTVLDRLVPVFSAEVVYFVA